MPPLLRMLVFPALLMLGFALLLLQSPLFDPLHSAINELEVPQVPRDYPHWQKAFANPTINGTTTNAELLLIHQPLNHFDHLATNVTYKQRVFVLRQHYQLGGPVFFYAGAESPVDPALDPSMFVSQLAASVTPGPLVVWAEHRYYGESVPPDRDFRHLAVSQALADYAAVIQEVRANISVLEGRQPKVMVWGGSYGGMLAAWMRYRYPHLVDLAYASSAPVTLCSRDRYSFFDRVLEDFTSVLPSCRLSLTKAFATMRRLGRSEAGRASLKRRIPICNQFSSDDDGRQLEYIVLQGMVNVAMFDYNAASRYFQPQPALAACRAMHSVVEFYKGLEMEDEEGIEIVKAFSTVALNSSYLLRPSLCLDIHSMRQCADRTGCGADPKDADPWAYAACTELILEASLRPDNGIVSADVLFSEEEIAEDCFQRFGLPPKRPAGLLAREFGLFPASFYPQLPEGIIWTAGSRDPWGTCSSTGGGRMIYRAEGGAHCNDMKPPADEDPQGLRDVRGTVRQEVMAALGLRDRVHIS